MDILPTTMIILDSMSREGALRMPGDLLRLLAWRQRFCPERTIFPKRIDYHQISSSPRIRLARRRKYPIGFSSLKCALIVEIEDCKSIQKRVQGSWNPDATLGLNCSQAGLEKGGICRMNLKTHAPNAPFAPTPLGHLPPEIVNPHSLDAVTSNAVFILRSLRTVIRISGCVRKYAYGS